MAKITIFKPLGSVNTININRYARNVYPSAFRFIRSLYFTKTYSDNIVIIIPSIAKSAVILHILYVSTKSNLITCQISNSNKFFLCIDEFKLYTGITITKPCNIKIKIK